MQDDTTASKFEQDSVHHGTARLLSGEGVDEV